MIDLRELHDPAALPPDWERLRAEAQVALSPPLLAAAAAAPPAGVRTTFLVADEGRRGGAALHQVTVRLDEQRFAWSEELVRRARELGRPDLLRFRALFCGLNLSQGRDDVIAPTPELIAAVAAHAEARARDLDLDGVLFGHLHEDRLPAFRAALDGRGYLLLPSLPFASLAIAWPTLGGYLVALRAGYRRQARAVLAARPDLAVELDLDLHAHAEAFTALYREVTARAEQKIEVVDAAFFRALAGGGARLIGLRQGDRLLAGAAVLRTPHRLCCLDVGLDYGAGPDLYPRLLIALVERAIADGVAVLDLGQTAADAKARLGATLAPTWLLARPRSPAVEAALRVERAHLRPAPRPVHRVLRAAPAPVAPPPTAAGDDDRRGGGEWAAHVNPELAGLLGLFHLDRTYVRGDGIHLIDSEGRAVLDLVSGYGALPFGHNPRFLWRAVAELAGRDRPQIVQGSLAPEAGQLAAALLRVAPPGLTRVAFASSGAEAVEVALKAARARTGRRGIVIAEGAFHGKTLGALSATPSRYYQEPFGAPAPGFHTVPYGDADALADLLATHSGEIAGVLLEPIQGEGGVIVPPAGYLAAARAACDRAGALLLVDEVQTGLGRTGALFACGDVRPDALLLSKALGGGLVPSAACLLGPAAWSEALALRHSSTFAGNTLAMTVGLVVLDRLTGDGGALLADVRRKGEALLARLRATAARCPVLVDVRGRGLLIGLELGATEELESTVLRHLGRQRELVPLLAGYLMAEHGVRVLPPLARKTTLRLLAPLDAADADLALVADALDDTIGRVQAGDVRALAAHMIGRRAAPPAPRPRPAATPWRPPADPAPLAGRFAFLLHSLDLHHYRDLEPSLCGAAIDELGAFDRLLRDLTDAVEISHVRLRSATGARCEGWFIGLPFTTRGLVGLTATESKRWLRAGVELARARGADIVGLGAFTSVVSGGGVGLRSPGIGLTTGNTYTAAVAAQAVRHAAAAMGVDPARATCAVVGAAGSVGRVVALLLARGVGRLILVGNPTRSDALRRLAGPAAEIRAFAPDLGDLELSTDAAAAVGAADLIVSATSAVGPVLQPAWLRPGAVICNVARPSDVSAEVRRLRPDVLVIDGGVVDLPEPQSLGWDFGFPVGAAYACMAETITLAFEGWRGDFGLDGPPTAETALAMAARAEKHGFRLAGLQSSGRPLTAEEVAAVRAHAGRAAPAPGGR